LKQWFTVQTVPYPDNNKSEPSSIGVAGLISVQSAQHYSESETEGPDKRRKSRWKVMKMIFPGCCCCFLQHHALLIIQPVSKKERGGSFFIVLPYDNEKEGSNKKKIAPVMV
jgi:hypothetical protein